jgi:hypothetical protein
VICGKSPKGIRSPCSRQDIGRTTRTVPSSWTPSWLSMRRHQTVAFRKCVPVKAHYCCLGRRFLQVSLVVPDFRSHFTAASSYPAFSTALSTACSTSQRRLSRVTLNRRACFSTMHRAPAAMVTKPMTDPNVTIRTPRDPNTLSNYHNFVTRHTQADFDIDFEKKVLSGRVCHSAVSNVS